MNTTRTNTLAATSRGTALLEFTAVLPTLVLLLFGMMEVANAVNQYLVVNSICYEGVRYAISLPGLEETPAGPVTQGQTTALPQNHEKVQMRIIDLLLYHKFSTTVMTNGVQTTMPRLDYLTTQLKEPALGSGTNIVEVRLSVPLQPLFMPFLSGVRLRVTSVGPYLVRQV
jgi:hypothetical protein